MKYIKTYKDKVKEYRHAIETENKLRKELLGETDEIKKLVIEILDEMLEENNNDEVSINVDIKTDQMRIYKIEHMNLQEGFMHVGGGDTIIFFKNENNKKDKDSLWNFFAGGTNNYEEIVGILEYLIKNYKKSYDNVMMKKDTKKYNL